MAKDALGELRRRGRRAIFAIRGIVRRKRPLACNQGDSVKVVLASDAHFGGSLIRLGYKTPVGILPATHPMPQNPSHYPPDCRPAAAFFALSP